MWFLLSLTAALFQAGQFAVVKGRARHISTLVLMLWAQALGGAAWAAYVVLTGRPLGVPATAWAWTALAVGLNLGMTYLLARGTAGGDISIVGPVLALSPIFSVVPDWALSGTLPHGLGWLGIAFSVVGTVTLSRGPGRRFDLGGLFAREDALCALGAAIILGMLSAVDRRMANSLDVTRYLAALYGGLTLVTAVLVAVRAPRAFAATLNLRDVAALLGHAVLAVAGNGLQITALTFAPAAYVNSARRTSSVFSVLMGRVLFGEPALAGRLLGAVLMGLGALCLLLGR